MTLDFSNEVLVVVAFKKPLKVAANKDAAWCFHIGMRPIPQDSAHWGCWQWRTSEKHYRPFLSGFQQEETGKQFCSSCFFFIAFTIKLQVLFLTYVWTQD
jgi:hypothetical protein